MRFYQYIFFLILVFASGGLKAQDVALNVISNPKGAPADLKMNVLKSILKGEKQRWPDGTKIVIALMKTNTPVGGTTCKKLYNMSGDELNKFWLALVFQGKGQQAPVFFSSPGELESFVAQTPGAIGISGSPGDDVKNITIDGKKSL